MATAKQSRERFVARGKVVPVGRPPTTSLQRLFLTCFVALSIFTVLSISILEREDVEVFLPDKFVAYLQQDLVDPDYRFRSSDIEFASLNETILAFAAYDPNEEEEKKRITWMLETNEHAFRNSINNGFCEGFQKKPGLFRLLDRPQSRVKCEDEPWILQLLSPRFSSSWPQFRQSLQRRVRSKRYDPRVIGELVESVKKPIDQFYSSVNKPIDYSVESKRYKTCAVVGNSGIILNNSLGSFIDSHDMVIRLNNARVKGFENSVGSKTTLSFVNSNVYNACSHRLKCFCHPYGNVPIAMYLTQSQHLMDFVFCENQQEPPLIVTDARFDMLCYRLVKWYSVKHYVETTGKSLAKWEQDHNGKDFHYSSGFQAIMLAVGICEKVDILGFGKSPNVKHHYHTNRQSELDLHDYEAEYRIYDDLKMKRTSSMPFLNVSGITLPEIRIYK